VLVKSISRLNLITIRNPEPIKVGGKYTPTYNREKFVEAWQLPFNYQSLTHARPSNSSWSDDLTATYMASSQWPRFPHVPSKCLFEYMVDVVFQSIFRLEMHKNNIYIYIYIYIYNFNIYKKTIETKCHT
jgi:hypothetical protein